MHQKAINSTQDIDWIGTFWKLANVLCSTRSIDSLVVIGSQMWARLVTVNEDGNFIVITLGRISY